MPLGTFTVTIDGNQLGAGTETSAEIIVRFSDGRQFVRDAEAGAFWFPHLSNEGRQPISLPYNLVLVTDVDTGVSETIGYEVTVFTKGQRRVIAGPFAAKAEGATVALTAVTSDFTGQVSESLAVRAETAAAEAETARTEAEAFGGTNNEQVATMVTTAGPTKDALSATAARVRLAELHDDYTGKGGTTGDVADSGQTWFDYPNTGDDRPTVITTAEGGVLTHAVHGDPGQIASYRQHDMGAPVTAMGGELVFLTDSAGTWNGVGALIPWDTLNTGTGVPDTRAHVVYGPTFTQIKVFVDEVPTDIPGALWIYSGDVATPPDSITLDGVTGHPVAWTHDKANSTLHVLLPTGKWVSVTDDVLADDLGVFACAETYALDGDTDPRAGWRNLWTSTAPQTSPAADRVTPAQLAQARQALEAQMPTPAVAFEAPSSDDSVALGGTPTVIVSTTCRTGPTGRIRVTMSAFVDITADGLLFYSLQHGASPLGTYSAGTKVAHGGQITLPVEIDTGEPNVDNYELEFRAAMATGTAVLKLHVGGADAFVASLTATPAA